MAQLIRILIPDDHALLRAGLRVLTDGEPSAQLKVRADHSTEIAWRARFLRPGMILLDLVTSQQDRAHGMAVIQMEKLEAHILVPRSLCEDDRAIAAIKVAVSTLLRCSNHARASQPDPSALHDGETKARMVLPRELTGVGPRP
jgi:DNA-binding NarL/FixJ family response regulator